LQAALEAAGVQTDGVASHHLSSGRHQQQQQQQEQQQGSQQHLQAEQLAARAEHTGGSRAAKSLLAGAFFARECLITLSVTC